MTSRYRGTKDDIEAATSRCVVRSVNLCDILGTKVELSLALVLPLYRESPHPLAPLVFINAPRYLWSGS